MRFWFDTEFYEDGHTIQLISIGVVAEDGRDELVPGVADADVVGPHAGAQHPGPHPADEQPSLDGEILHITPAEGSRTRREIPRTPGGYASVPRLLRPARRVSGSSWYSRILR